MRLKHILLSCYGVRHYVNYYNGLMQTYKDKAHCNNYFNILRFNDIISIHDYTFSKVKLIRL